MKLINNIPEICLISAIILFVIDDYVIKKKIRLSDLYKNMGEKEKSIEALNNNWFEGLIGNLALLLGVIFFILVLGVPICRYLIKFIEE